MSGWEELRDSYGGPMRYLSEGYLHASSPVPTNIPPLDECLCGGMRPGMHVLGGEPGAGKSALGLFLSMTSALSGANVMFLSLEMSAAQCWSRCLSHLSLQTEKPFRWGDVWRLAADERERQSREMQRGNIKEYMEGFMERDPVGKAACLALDKCPGLLIADTEEVHEIAGIEEAAKKARPLGLSLLVVDYLQYVDCATATDEYGRVSTVSKRLNRLGVDLDVPVLALASHNRAANNSKPSMHSFKGSGDIEYHAVSAWVLERDTETPGRRVLRVVKNRFGTTTNEDGIPLTFDGAHNSFELA